MNPTSRIYIAGAHTLIGGAIVRHLVAEGFTNIVRADEEPDVADSTSVDRFFERAAPEYVIVAAGKTAGIAGNMRWSADLMRDNLLVASHVIPAASSHRVKKLLYLASSCIYPRHAPQPLQASSLWTGPLEPTSAAYAMAKLAGIQLCDAYRQQYGAPFVSAIAADVYGPGDDFSPETAHVAAALIHRMHDAKLTAAPAVDIWGTGRPRRELIYADDLAAACLFAMRHYDAGDPINLGTGADISIAELASLVRDVLGYSGALRFDTAKPDGTPFKRLDSTLLRDMGWRPRIDLRTGLERTYQWFLSRLVTAGNARSS